MVCRQTQCGRSLIPLFHRDFSSSFTRRKQDLFLLITHWRISCHSQMNLICVCRLSGQCLSCQVWSDEVKMSDEGTKCRAQFTIGCYFRSQIDSVLDKCWVRVGCVSGSCCATMGRVQQTSDESLLSVCNLQSAWQPSLVQHSSEGNMIFSTVIQHS